MFEALDQLMERGPLFGEAAAESEAIVLREGERRIVTILFADMQGFTSLSERLDPEQTHAILDKALTMFTRTIVRYGGYVDKYEGDLVMALFGAKQASEHDAERAIFAGLEMLDGLRRFSDALSGLPDFSREGITLNLRIGINSGLVTTGRVGAKREGDFTVYGDPVNLASRMESHAPVNRIMLPFDVASGLTGKFDFDDLGEIEVKGKSQPIRVGTVSHPRQAPQRLRAAGMTYVGRSAERQLLTDTHDQVEGAIGQVDTPLSIVGIVGEAGIGKTRLLDEWIAMRPEVREGENLVRAETNPYVSNPYGLFAAVVRDAVGAADFEEPGAAKQKLERAYANLAEYCETSDECRDFQASLPLIGYLLGLEYDDIRLRALDGKELQDQIRSCLRHFMEILVRRANLQGEAFVLVLEDLHWVDEGSQALLESFIATLNLEERRESRQFKQLLLILVYRPQYEVGPQVRHRRFVEIPLEPLAADESGRLIDGMLDGTPIAEPVRQQLLSKAAGNPFFIEQWILWIAGREQLEETDLPVPDTLQALVLSRLDQLEGDLKAMLQRASVLGMRFASRLLLELEQRLARTPNFDDRLLTLTRRQWVQRESPTADEYLFRHVVTQEVAYSTLLLQNRRVLHRLAAEVLEARGDLAEHHLAIYTHYRLAGVTGKRIQFGLKAASKLQADCLYAPALSVYDDVLEALREESDDLHDLHLEHIVEVQYRRSELLETLGRMDDAVGACAAAIDHAGENRRWLGVLYHQLGTLAHHMGDIEGARKHLDQAGLHCHACGDDANLALVVGAVGVLHTFAGEFDKARTFFEQRLQICRALGDERGEGASIGNIGGVLYHQGQYDQAMEFFRQRVASAEETGNMQALAGVTGNMGLIHVERGEHDEALACFYRQLGIAEELGHKRSVAGALGNIGMVRRNFGDFRAAEEALQRALLLNGELGDRRQTLIAYANLGDLETDRGNFGAAMEWFEKQRAVAEEIGDRLGITMAAGSSGLVHMERGEFDQAGHWFDRQQELLEELGSLYMLPGLLLNRARLMCHLERFAEARDCVERGLAAARESGQGRLVFPLSVQSARVQLAQGAADDARLALMELQNGATSDEQRAAILYELWRVALALKDGTAENHRGEAARLYQRLFEAIPRHEYHIRLLALQI